MMQKRSTTLGHLVGIIGYGKVVGNPDRRIWGVQHPDGSSPDMVTAVWEKRILRDLAQDVPVICQPGWIDDDRDRIEVEDPQFAFAKILAFFKAEERPGPPGIHLTAWVAESAEISSEAFIGPFCVIGEHCRINPDVVLEAGVFVGKNVEIGRGTYVEPGVVLYHGTHVGEDCLIRARTVIGCDGFGFLTGRGDEPVKIPQLGTVRIGNRVEIGAGSTIDRATIGETVIGDGTVIDDQVHVGHNARIGKGCILVAMTGIAGSAVLEDNVIMAARSGVADHVKVGRGATVAAYGGATRDVPEKTIVSGFPAREHFSEMKKQALLRKLPDLANKVKQLEKRIKELEDTCNGKHS
ncbi:MAG: UDP-3-O-(3-hydroxymyristoyl)glucosamine N-acyltransferase [Thermovirgaceae bacterium]